MCGTAKKKEQGRAGKGLKINVKGLLVEASCKDVKNDVT